MNTTNEHGNSPLHYACFWGYQAIAEELVNHGALVSVANKDGDTPLDKTKTFLANRLHDLAIESGQELRKISFKDQSWLGLKTRSRDATLSRYKGINIRDLELHTKLAMAPSGDTWRGRWQKNDIVAKILSVRDCSARISRDFNEEFPKLRIFSHPNILPVIGACNAPPNLVVISQVRLFHKHREIYVRLFMRILLSIPVHATRIVIRFIAWSGWRCGGYSPSSAIRTGHCPWNGISAFTRTHYSRILFEQFTCHGRSLVGELSNRAFDFFSLTISHSKRRLTKI